MEARVEYRGRFNGTNDTFLFNSSIQYEEEDYIEWTPLVGDINLSDNYLIVKGQLLINKKTCLYF